MKVGPAFVNLNEPPKVQKPVEAKTLEQKKLLKACRDFEGIMLAQIMKGLRATVPKTDLFGSNKDEETWRDMLDSEVCKLASRQNGLGLSDQLYRQLSKILERQSRSEKTSEKSSENPDFSLNSRTEQSNSKLNRTKDGPDVKE